MIWEKPEAGTGLLDGHPLNVGLIASFPLNQKTTQGIRDASGRYVQQAQSGTVNPRVGIGGPGLSNTTSSSETNFANITPTDYITVESWFIAGAAQSGALSFPAGQDSSYILCYDHSAASFQGHFAYRPTSSGFVSSGSSAVAIPSGVPVHMVGTYDGVNLSVYVNGVLKSQAAQPGLVMFSSGLRFTIGGVDNVGLGAGFVGQILKTGVWQRALRPSEILQLYVDPWCHYQKTQPKRRFFRLNRITTTAYTLTASAGSYVLTGVAAGLRVGRKLTAATGVFALTGVAARLAVARRLTCSAGSFALTGVAAGLHKGFTLTAGAGSYALTGVAATFRRTYALAALSGSYVLTGNPATLTYSAATGAWTTVPAPSGVWSDVVASPGIWTRAT